jgi:hypothetical protein
MDDQGFCYDANSRRLPPGVTSPLDDATVLGKDMGIKACTYGCAMDGGSAMAGCVEQGQMGGTDAEPVSADDCPANTYLVKAQGDKAAHCECYMRFMGSGMSMDSSGIC